MRRRLNIIPLSYRGGPKTGLTFTFLLWYDQNTGRRVVVHTPWAGWKTDPSKPNGLHHILESIMDASAIPRCMTKSEFLAFEWKQFKNVRISDRIL